MIFSVDFGSSQTGVGYQFMDNAGNLLGVHETDVTAGAQPGMFFFEKDPPGNAIVIIWDCADPSIIARDDFQEARRLEGMGATSEATPIVVSSVLEIPGSLQEEFEADLTDAISGYEQSFVWNGRRISCEINLRASRLN